MGKCRPGIVALLCLACTLWAGAAGAQEEPPGKRAETVEELIAKMGRDDFAGRDACEKLIAIGKPAVPGLIEALAHEAPRVRYWSIAALSGIGEDAAVDPIRKRLDDPDPLVRAVAVWHLGRWFDRKGVRGAVLARLGDKDEFVRGWVLKLIVHKRYMGAVPRVMALLNDRDERVRYDALHAIARLKGPPAIVTLAKVLQKDKSAMVRECAVRCCTVIDPPTPRTAEVLIMALGDEDKAVRELAARLLRKGFDQSFGFRAGGTIGEREKAILLWRQWYGRNKDILRWDEKRRVFVARAAEKPEPEETESDRTR